jgi:hypothetical protein
MYRQSINASVTIGVTGPTTMADSKSLSPLRLRDNDDVHGGP